MIKGADTIVVGKGEGRKSLLFQNDARKNPGLEVGSTRGGRGYIGRVAWKETK